MSAYDRLKALGLSLPQVTAPVAAFVPFVRAGGLVFVSGHIAKRDGAAQVPFGACVEIDLVAEAA